MSQKNVADELGTSQTNVSLWERKWKSKRLESLNLDGGLEERGIINRAQLKFSENDLAHLQRIANNRDDEVKARQAAVLLRLYGGEPQRVAASAVGRDQSWASRVRNDWHTRGMEMFTDSNPVAERRAINTDKLGLNDPQELARLNSIATDNPTTRRQRRAKILVMYASGLDQYDIAEEMNTSQSRVSLILTRWITHRWKIF